MPLLRLALGGGASALPRPTRAGLRPGLHRGAGAGQRPPGRLAEEPRALRALRAQAGGGGSTRGVYLPAYLYGARARADYRAQIGENYTETETYTTTDSKGKSVTRTRTVVKTEWRSLSGLRDSYVLDVVVTASRGVPNQELEAIEPFDLRALRRYSPALLSGWIAEEPSLLREQCVAQAHGEAEDGIGRELDGFMPGDSHRALEYRVAVEDETADLVLLPLWVFAVRYAEDKPPVRILLNGQTGSIGGRVPLSAIKITLAILFVLTLVAALVLVLSRS